MTLKILILGANGFIGSHLVDRILHENKWEVVGMDLSDDKVRASLNHPLFDFSLGDITRELAWIEEQVKKCDVVFPLVAIANPTLYVKDPLRVFELDFEANLAVVRLCVKYKKRVIFPSTSEVYGMCPDKEFDEEKSPFVLGPISKPRWIYSCSKQLMDRVITAYGEREGLPYTLFRPFNWMGPRLDNPFDETKGSSRAFSQFLGNIIRGKDIQLVNGGAQRRSFTYIGDGIDALMAIIENKGHQADSKIFNLGNPNNDVSIRELAELLINEIKGYPKYTEQAQKVKLISVEATDYFGGGYQDVAARVPSIKNAEKYLNWTPKTDLQTAIRVTLAHIFHHV